MRANNIVSRATTPLISTGVRRFLEGSGTRDNFIFVFKSERIIAITKRYL